MDQRTLNIINVALIIVILSIAIFSWFYMRDQFMWAILLIILIAIVAIFVNATGRGVRNTDAAIAVAAIVIMGFAWFYMREQFCFAGFFVILLIVLGEYIKLKKWLKDVVSIQVIVHKNEKDEEKQADERDNK